MARGGRCSFSTLYGSKWVATILERIRLKQLPSFSTLYGSKWVATEVCWQAVFGKDEFQYPLRVEVGCNHSGNTSSGS